MKLLPILLVIMLAAAANVGVDAAAPQFGPLTLASNRDLLLGASAAANQGLRIERSTNLVDWEGLATFLSTGAVQYTDSTAALLPHRFYRGRELPATNLLTGDHLASADGEITIHPINHATFLLTWEDKVIYFDPVGGAARLQGLPKADLMLVTHAHSDHFEAASLNLVKGSNAVLLVPAAVYQGLPANLKSLATVLTNGASTNLLGLSVEAVPAYNLTSTFHPKGTGNGYVLTVGGRRIYVSGDTEDIPELRALKDIDVAFVCMNLPFTMSVDKAVSAVREFRPQVVYVYHYSGYSSADVNRFKASVGTDRGIEVRLRKWE